MSYVFELKWRETMFWETADTVIRREIQIDARRIILDLLEGGPKTGIELREAIKRFKQTQEMDKAREEKRKLSKKQIQAINVTDPHLYHNTKHLENLQIITSRKSSRIRLFGLVPWAIQPVRRVLGVTRPAALITSMSRPEDQRPFITWLNEQKDFDIRSLHVIVEDRTFARGSSRDLARYLPEKAEPKWEIQWHDLPVDSAGNYDTNIPGDVMLTQREIENIITDNIKQFDLVIDLSTGPPLIVLALSLLAMHYSLSAIFVNHKDGSNIITRVLPRG
ncbi:MAG: hypothetical protein ACW974_07175 [Candidatus Thorarchaeota archaeon]|jgi:hypothetical protein